jgi:hypothetical protein
LEQRFQSYNNYVDLFNSILSAEVPLALDLPIQWLWDIIDEFIYQFQSFCQYRAKLVKKGQNIALHNFQDEILQLKQDHQVIFFQDKNYLKLYSIIFIKGVERT